MNQHPLLELLVQEFEGVGRQIYSDGVWECEVGALVLSHLCNKAGIEHTLQVGLYWWKDKAERFRAMEGHEPSKRELKSYLADEHHHWVEITDDRFPEALIVDPNAEIRNEPRIALKSAAKHYEPKPKLRDCSDVGPGSDPYEAAEWLPKVAEALAIIDHTAEPVSLPNPGIQSPRFSTEGRSK